MTAAGVQVVRLVDGVQRVRDTCNVYVLRPGRDAVVIDFGSGSCSTSWTELGIDRVTDVLVTHHHRDQVQGLAAGRGRRERDLGAAGRAGSVRRRRASTGRRRQLDNDYDLRQDRFSLLESVPVAGTVRRVPDGARYGGFDVYVLPTPGHTIGSVTYLVELAGRRRRIHRRPRLRRREGLVARGDAVVVQRHRGRWRRRSSRAASLARAEPDVLLPSHGEPIEDPPAALALVRERMQELVDLRREQPWALAAWLRDRPFDPVTPHLLRNRTCLATATCSSPRPARRC